MFWRFGFHYTSSIDSLLGSDDLTVDILLDEEDLLQECKAKNPRLAEYLSLTETLKELLKVACMEGNDPRRSQLAVEVLCCDIHSIVENCAFHADQILAPVWEATLSHRQSNSTAFSTLEGNFVKIITSFLNKMPAEILEFIKRQPDAIETVLAHIESPQFSELLFCLLRLHDHPGCGNVLEVSVGSDHLANYVQ